MHGKVSDARDALSHLRYISEYYPSEVGQSDWNARVPGGSETAGITIGPKNTKSMIDRLRARSGQVREQNPFTPPSDPEPAKKPDEPAAAPEVPGGEVEIPPVFDPFEKGGLFRTARRDMDRFLSAIQATLQYMGYSLDESNRYIDTVVNELTDAGMLPKLSPDSDDAAISRWMDAAAAVGLASMVVDRA